VSLIQALLNPAAYPHPVDNIELIETHISWVLLTGYYAYKIKKNIQFDFLDFSSLEKRHYYCDEELRFNGRFAPDLYLKVVPITGSLLKPHINGNGDIIEYAVQMKQFDGSQLLSHIAERGKLTATIIDQLAELTANFHNSAKADTSSSQFGTAQEIHHWFQGNFAHIKPLIKHTSLLQQILALEQWGEQVLLNITPLMQQRKQQGFIRECHGDLHLGNITLIDGKVTPFDGIEFNPSLHWIDTISEIAFVVMDLQQRGFPNLAYRFLNRYLSKGGDYQGIALLPYYLVYRALVRCKVALLRWQQHQNPQDFQEAQTYADLATRYSLPKPARLLITHGYSGSGKSTLSAQLAENSSMIHLRSDVERQRLLNKARQNTTNNELNQGLYTPEKVLFIYQKLAELAATSLQAGFSVLIDAAFLQSSQRELFAQLASNKKIAFAILDFYAPEQELKRRISQRQHSGTDASEATLAVLEHQLKTAQPLTAVELEKTIQVDTCDKDALHKIMADKALAIVSH
jgi:aminoglycoside phosphotransferase family enzyme/adenylate kinase family enzyme